MPDAFPAFASPFLDVRSHFTSEPIARTHGVKYNDDEMGSEEDDSLSAAAAPDSDSNNVMMECSNRPKDGAMIESYDRRELIALNTDHQPSGGCPVQTQEEPYQGMEFDTEEDARLCYNAYATRIGFSVRVSRCHRSIRDGSIICRRFVCSREGFCIHNKNQDNSKRQRTNSRVGCMAMLAVKKQQDTGKWIVNKFVKEHNHDLEPCVMVEEVKKVEKDTEQKKEMFVHKGSSELEPFEGMEFQSEECARTFYYAYAKEMGFTVRISKCRRGKDGSIICRRFVCSKEGYYVRKYGSTKRSRALTRVGCLARLVVKKLDSGIWVVANFDKEHNHPPFVVGNELSYNPPKPSKQISRSDRPVSSRDEAELQNSHNSLTWRFNTLHQEGIRFAEEGATSVGVFNVAMFALREATQKVVTAKKNASMVPIDNLVSGSNQVGATDVASNSDESGQVLATKLPNGQRKHCGLETQLSSAIKLLNGQVVQGGSDIQPLSDVSPAAHRLDGNGSLVLGTSAARQRKDGIKEDELNFISVQDFSKGGSKQDGAATQPQGWNILGVGQHGPNIEGGGNSSSMALSKVQMAALQAVPEAFNVHTMGATSSSALPIKVLPVSHELMEGNKNHSFLHGSPCQSVEMPPQQSQDTSGTPGPNPLVHAAAIAAGARIAPPEVAASLIKAVQSRNAVHIRSNGKSLMPKVPSATNNFGTGPLTSPPQIHSQIPKTHHLEVGDSSAPQHNVGVVPDVILPTDHLIDNMVIEGSDMHMQSIMLSDHTDVSSAKLEQEQAMYYSMVHEPYTVAQLHQQNT